MAYVVPIHHAGSVRHAIKSRFLSPEEECLVVAKSSRLEFYAQSPDGLLLQHVKAIYGIATCLRAIPRPDPSATDLLFIGTDRHAYFTVSWDPGAQQLRTERKYMDLAENLMRGTDRGERCHIDPTGRFLTLEVYEGIVTVIPIAWEGPTRPRRPGPPPVNPQPSEAPPEGGLAEPLPARIEELWVRATAFLDRDKDDRSPPRMAILYEDFQGKLQLKLRELDYTPSTVTGDGSAEVDLKELDVLSVPLDLGATMLIPVPNPLGGLLIVGEKLIKYVDEKRNQGVALPLDEPTVFVSWEQIDGQRWLLADDFGRLFFLMLILNDYGAVERWNIDYLGVTAHANAMVYLGGGVTFIGSTQGDSKVIRITERSFETIQTISSIAPILDFTVMDLGSRSSDDPTHEFSSGQARIVTASGAFYDGSLRSVRSGVGIEELGVLGSMEHITDLWGLGVSCREGVFDSLLVSFVTETRIFRFSPEGEVEEEDEFFGLSLAEPTIFAGNIAGQRILQVCEHTARVADLESGMIMWEWSPSDSQAITAASSNDTYLVLVVGGQNLAVFDITGDVKLLGEKSGSHDSQISGVTLTTPPTQACIVCLPRSAELLVLDVPGLTVKHTTSLGTPGDDVPRSVLLANVLEDKPATLFVAMADGSVFSFSFDATDYSLTSISKVILGSQQPSLEKLPRGDGYHNVFATCEHPSLIYASHDRIIYSAVSAERATRVCHFSTEAFPGAIAVATPDDLKISVVDTERTTQIQTLMIHETVRRVVYSPADRAFGIGTIKRTIENAVESVQSRFVLADEIMFRTLSHYDLNIDELVESAIKADFPMGKDDMGNEQYKTLFIVGTAHINEEAPEDGYVHGRILVFEVSKSRELNLVTERRVKGACKVLTMANNEVIAGLSKSVTMFTLTRNGSNEFSLEKGATFRSSTGAADIAVTGNMLVIADLMKSVSLVEYTPGKDGEPDNLTEIAHHFQTLWCTAVAHVSDNSYLISDGEGNLVIVRQNKNGVTEEDRKRMEVTAEFKLGEIVNRMQVVNVRSSPEAVVAPRAFLGTTEGSIYLFGLISPNYQDLLMRLQSAIGSVVISAGEMPFDRYRAFKTEVRQADEPFRVVDGELIERFLACDPDMQEAIVHRIRDKNVSVEYVRQIAEELRRLH